MLICFSITIDLHIYSEPTPLVRIREIFTVSLWYGISTRKLTEIHASYKMFARNSKMVSGLECIIMTINLEINNLITSIPVKSNNWINLTYHSYLRLQKQSITVDVLSALIFFSINKMVIVIIIYRMWPHW